MIFRQWQQVLDGTKTQTRRLVKDGDHAYYNDEGRLWRYSLFGHGAIIAIWRNGRRWLEVGCTYAIQPGRGKKAVGRILLTEIRRERVQNITPRAAKAEGVDPYIVRPSGASYIGYVQAFVNLWDNIHKKPGTRWDDNPEVWVLSFEAV